jgi:hypothetical protein
VPLVRAPLLLQPVSIHARTASENDFTVQLRGDLELNPVLMYVLDRTRGLAADAHLDEQLQAAQAESGDPRLQAREVFRVLAEALGGDGQEARFDEQIIVGVFSFEKMPMVEDLRASTDLLAAHDVVAAIAGYEPAEAVLSGRAPEPAADPDAIPPGDELIVLDADASQHAAIRAALSGRHVLVDGPPGTGKSQNIANIITCLAAAGKRVLFVAEKRAAIEAVTDRLNDEKIKLAHLVFDLHDRKTSRRYVARQLAEGLERNSREAEPQLGDLHRRLDAQRAEVKRYVTELHAEYEPWRVSFYQASTPKPKQRGSSRRGNVPAPTRTPRPGLAARRSQRCL